MTFFRIVFASTILIFVVSCSSFKSCLAEEFMQRTVADGVARLSVPSISMIAKLVGQIAEETVDEKIFVFKKSDPSLVLLGEDKYGKGELTWVVDNAELKFTNKKVYSDCQNTEFFWNGTVKIIKATQTHKGTVIYDSGSGKPKKVIPDSVEKSIAISIQAEVENFSITNSAIKQTLLLKKGLISFDVYPRLAQNTNSASKAFQTLTAQTSNTAFENIKIQNAVAVLNSPDDGLELEIPIADSNYSIQVGEGYTYENRLNGTITVFGQEQELNYDGLGMDPNYNREEFRKTYHCSNELLGKVKFNHKPVENGFSSLAAGMSSVLLGETAKQIEKNYQCGFLNPENLRKLELTKKMHAKNATIRLTASDCSIDFKDHQTMPDAFGKAYVLNGNVKVDEAKQLINGLVTYTPENFGLAIDKYEQLMVANKFDEAKKLALVLKPVLPTSTKAVSVELALSKFENLSIIETCLEKEGQVNDSRHCRYNKEKSFAKFIFLPAEQKNSEDDQVIEPIIKAKLFPKLAKDMRQKSVTFGMCVAETSNTRVKLALTKVKADYYSGNDKLGFMFDGDLEIVSGVLDNKENYIHGNNFTVSKQLVSFDNDDDIIRAQLDPKYNQTNFKDSYFLRQPMKEVADEECIAEKAIGLNVLRTIVQNLGGIAVLAGEKVLKNLDALKSHKPGESIEGSFETLSNRVVDLKVADIQSKKFIFGGKINEISASMTTTGEKINRGKYVGAFSSLVKNQNYLNIKPNQSLSYSIDLEATLERFSARGRRSNAVFDLSPSLEMSGKIFSKIQPFFGRSLKDQSFSVETPLARFNDVMVPDAVSIFKLGFMTVPLKIITVHMEAQNGVYKGRGNNISGTIKFKIQRNPHKEHFSYEDIVIEEGTLLDPYYDQDEFNRSYASTPDLADLLPWQ